MVVKLSGKGNGALIKFMVQHLNREGNTQFFCCKFGGEDSTNVL